MQKTIEGSTFGLEIVVGGDPPQRYEHNGKSYICHHPLPEVEHNDQTYVAAPHGWEYRLRFIVPDNGKRYLAVCTIDGLSIRPGQPKGHDGWVITPPSHPSANDVPGFDVGDNEVVRFKFGDRDDSLAAQIGDDPGKIGTIEVVYYAEEIEDASTRSSGARGADMGTGLGSVQEFKVAKTEFMRGAEVTRLTLKYASERQLAADGIVTQLQSFLREIQGDTGIILGVD